MRILRNFLLNDADFVSRGKIGKLLFIDRLEHNERNKWIFLCFSHNFYTSEWLRSYSNGLKKNIFAFNMHIENIPYSSKQVILDIFAFFSHLTQNFNWIVKKCTENFFHYYFVIKTNYIVIYKKKKINVDAHKEGYLKFPSIEIINGIFL